MSLTTQSVPNFEEAASVASEFITSLDNLPHEVQHLLSEIKLKDQRCQELQQDIARDQLECMKLMLKQGFVSVPPNIMQKSGTNSPAPNSKSQALERISAAYAQIDALNGDKMELAQRIITLITRTRARLDVDLAKVRTLQGEPAEDIRTSYIAATNSLRSASPYSIKRHETPISLTPVIQIGESLRSAVSTAQPDALISISNASGPGYNKKRRLTTNTSIKLPSPVPASVARESASHSRSRLSRQSQTSHLQQRRQEEEDLDADAEGEEDLEGEDVDDDTTLYCLCHKQSYGDMIGCDNPDCPYQWFHISCVGVKTPLPDKWYCPVCTKNKSIPSEKRKSRKK
ncbi:hypothetical protein CPB84DRAFT_1758980 [Gymnopilus junonius]|uniref:Chromatin modification-related protein n=1 Tax=Gymnopilus junonius TaxID=109634 RepID=A0A9P5NZD4_GYMJU|nr:hypothetical protein CPB84DRAFT_1758980 [Gymnopilus junonius]